MRVKEGGIGTIRENYTGIGERQNGCHQSERAPDRELVLAFQRGSRDAFAQIYERHRARVAGTCSRILDNPSDVQEAVQETFLRAYTALGRFNGNFQTAAWLRRIATNVCLDLLRAQSRHAPLVLVPWFNYELPDGDNVEEILTAPDPRVREAIDQIQPLHARALKLRAVEGMSHEEIAGRLAMSPSQVKALLHRARRSFKRAFERAGNWAAAPLAGLRHLVHKGRDAAAGHPLVAATAPGGAVFAERAAAGVVAVAMAWSAPAAPAPPAPGGPPAVPVGSTAVEAAPPEEGKIKGTIRDRKEPHAASKPEGPRRLPDAALTLIERAEGVAEARPAPPPPNGGDEDDEQLDLPGVAEAANAERVGKQGKAKIERALKRRAR